MWRARRVRGQTGQVLGPKESLGWVSQPAAPRSGPWGLSVPNLGPSFEARHRPWLVFVFGQLTETTLAHCFPIVLGPGLVPAG